MLNLKTPEQVKKEFEAQGQSFADWAKENGYDRFYVYCVLNDTIMVRGRHPGKNRENGLSDNITKKAPMQIITAAVISPALGNG
ncbi:hypothetical protein [Chelonobacter oris]|uniref:hypothetical protein n=1 Tax=Chelonobacter oris TaxID=505317 RepID=UPI0024474FB1|nr:hypothetical protein [Chelonobacter oris]